MGLKSQCDAVGGLLACTLTSYPHHKLHHSLRSKEATLFLFNIRTLLTVALLTPQSHLGLSCCPTQVTVDLSSAAIQGNSRAAFQGW